MNKPEKTIVSTGCVLCPFQNDYNRCNLNWNLFIGNYCLDEKSGRHPECPLLNNSIRVMVEL
jgi:hypothetical protein